jgi:chloramphenicol O-acetyltransferase type A
MTFQLIDLPNWKRKEYFDYYFTEVPCSYSITVNVDISTLLISIKQKNIKLYPCIIYLLTSVVNKHEEFRTALDETGALGIFDVMHPSYTVFSKDTETFTNIWTPYNPSFTAFYDHFQEDIAQYGSAKQFIGKPHPPTNVITISSIPWVTFTGFNLNIPKASDYLLPIFTTGKYFEQNNTIQLPLSIQVHHAVCDGFHVARFINAFQEQIHQFAKV